MKAEIVTGTTHRDGNLQDLGLCRNQNYFMPTKFIKNSQHYTLLQMLTQFGMPTDFHVGIFKQLKDSQTQPISI